MMKTFHPLSFVFGLISGMLVLLVYFGGTRLVQTPQSGVPSSGGFGRQGTGAPNLTHMAERFGMTEDELRKELAGGKTLQQIAEERGVQFGRRRNGSGSLVTTGSGAAGNPGERSGTGTLRNPQNGQPPVTR